MLPVGLALVLLSACGGEPQPTSFAGVTVVGGSAYLASNLYVHKFDARTGKEFWRFPGTQDGQNPVGPFAGQPLKFGDQIIVGGTLRFGDVPDRRLYALSDVDGSEVWRFLGDDTTREYADGVVTDGRLIFAPNGNGTLYALDPTQLQDGQPRIVWAFKTGDRLWSRPAVADGRVYIPSLDHTLYAVDAADGKEIWRFTAGASIASTPTLSDGRLYFGSFDQSFYALNAADGTLLWKAPVEGWIWCQALVDRDLVLVGDVKGKVYAFDAASGKRLWTAQTGGPVRAQPVAVDDYFYIVSFDSYLYRLPRRPTLDANGATSVQPVRVLENGLGRRLLSTPQVFESLLLVPLFDGDIKLVAVDLATDRKAYEFRVAP